MKVYLVYCDDHVEGVFDSENLAIILKKALEHSFPSQKISIQINELNKMPDLQLDF